MISSAHARPLQLPMRFTVAHTAAARATTSSLLVTLTDDDGRRGHGEGCPRPYVTNETLAGSLAAFEALRPRLADAPVDDLSALTTWLDSTVAARDPSVRCALEMALLDLHARRRARAVHEVVGRARDTVTYSGVIAVDGLEAVRRHAALCARLGLPDVKLKVGRDADANRARVDAVRALVGDGVTLRVDANMAWSAEEADAHVEGLLDRGVTYVEQPLPAEARDATVALAARWPNRILLDESLVSPQDLDTFVEAGAPIRALWKVGKNGGPLATLRLARAAEDAGIPCHLGAHVGESSLLSAAGRLVGGRGRFETLEGSFGALLLERDLTDPPLSFGPGGVAPTAWSDGPGWGFDVVLGD